MFLSDFDFDLPDELIARFPAAERRGSRLLVVDIPGDKLSDRRFADLPTLLSAGDLLVMNDTRVIKARLHGRKESGGKVEILVERVTGEKTAVAHIRSSKSPKSGARIDLAGDGEARVLGRARDLYALDFSQPVEAFLERHGDVPLPPYLDREAEESDVERYQTVYARQPGAVAAPTAGLHFDQALLAELEAAGIRHRFVTLHVGAGTFQSLRHENMDDNRLHAERIEIDASTCAAINETRRQGGRIVAVGTTTVRALETATRDGETHPFDGESDLFIRPGYRFSAIDALLTNFHLPRSSLLMLVAALAGHQRILAAYAHAVTAGYRFFSYGDAMLILPRVTPR